MAAAGMAGTIWGPRFYGKTAWALPDDLWGTLIAAQRLAHLNLGGEGVQAGQVQVGEPLGGDQRPPQVVGQRPGGLAVEARSPDRARHPGGGHDHGGEQRE